MTSELNRKSGKTRPNFDPYPDGLMVFLKIVIQVMISDYVTTRFYYFFSADLEQTFEWERDRGSFKHCIQRTKQNEFAWLE